MGYDPVLAAVVVRPVPDRIGQILVQSLREQLNPSGAKVDPRYTLTMTMAVTLANLGIARDNTSSRGELTINLAMHLAPAGSETAIYNDQIHTVTSYNLPNDAYAATVAADKAREEAADEISREVALRVAVYLRRQRAANGS